MWMRTIRNWCTRRRRRSDALTYTLGGPDADKFVINVDGSVSFVTAPDFEAPGSAAGTNSYSFSVTASDGTLSDVER